MKSFKDCDGNGSTPTSEQFKYVLSKLKKVLPLADFEGHLDMREISLPHSREHICGTPMCHGGWYAVALGIYDDDRGYEDFETGVDLMAQHLGFERGYDLGDWASNNPDIWGGRFGEEMFSHKMAFNNAETLTDIYNWWARVHNRAHPNAEPVEVV